MGNVGQGMESAMKMKEGDMVRSIWDGKVYVITKIVNSMVALRSREGEKRLVTEIDSLKIFYRSMDEVLKRINNDE